MLMIIFFTKFVNYESIESKDCDQIKKALLETFEWKEISMIYKHLNKLVSL